MHIALWTLSFDHDFIRWDVQSQNLTNHRSNRIVHACQSFRISETVGAVCKHVYGQSFLTSKDLINHFRKSHTTLVPYPTIYHIGTEICTFLFQSGVLWIMGQLHLGICEIALSYGSLHLWWIGIVVVLVTDYNWQYFTIMILLIPLTFSEFVFVHNQNDIFLQSDGWLMSYKLTAFVLYKQRLSVCQR